MKVKSIFDGKGGKRRTVRPLDDAATVILLREGTAGPFECFFVRRQRRQAFMGGAFVFPGGRLEPADADPELSGFLGGFSPDAARRLLQEPDLADGTALGLFMAAIRETFEEAGVLLARTAEGEPIDPERSARLAASRSEIQAGALTPLGLARRERLCYAPDLLLPYSHWITPEAEPRRFDTRFFLAALPAGQIPIHDRIEHTDSRWMTPAAALADHAAGRIVLMPPTLKTIEELQAFPSLADLLAATRAKWIPAILPEIFRTEEGFGIRLPTDSQYAGAAPLRAARPGETTRIVMDGGIWKSCSEPRRD